MFACLTMVIISAVIAALRLRASLGDSTVQTKPIFSTPSFLGAQGHGTFTSGGRSGFTYLVTHLGSDGFGSLKYGCEQLNMTRTIIFAPTLYGVIETDLIIKYGSLTIAGQTAGNLGITLLGSVLVQNASNIIMRFIRIRPNRLAATAGQSIAAYKYHALSVFSSCNLVFDHMSMSW
jgi:hypothetical protein